MKTKFYDLRLRSALMAILFAFLFAPGLTTAQSTVIIGDTTSTLNNYQLPVNAYYDYSWSAQIYKESEFGNTFGNITTVSFHVNNNPSNFLLRSTRLHY